MPRLGHLPYRYHRSMIKTTVYLPEPLKRQLQRLAKRTGRSEAQLIRNAIERTVQEQSTPGLDCHSSQATIRTWRAGRRSLGRLRRMIVLDTRGLLAANRLLPAPT